MAKTLLSYAFLILFAWNTNGQSCTPDQTYADSTSGVYPPPYDPVESPHGGIRQCAIIGQPFSFDFTVVVGDTIRFGSFAFPLDSIRITEVQNLPVGLNYICNPPTCSFPKNSVACANLFGAPTSTNSPGAYDLKIIGEAFVNGSSLPFPMEFPNAQLAPGKYTIHLLADDTTPCPVTAVSEAFQGRMSMLLMPNPASNAVMLKISSMLSGNFRLRVIDLLGRATHQQMLNLQPGEQSLQIDCSLFTPGIYTVMLSNEKGFLTEKLVIQN